MQYPSPPKSKRAVARASRSVLAGNPSATDLKKIDQWRASHGYVINTFQALIKGRLKRMSIQADFAQRLKRQDTVLDKLTRVHPDGTPLIKNIISMHDIAGCRLIFDNINDLNTARTYLRSSGALKTVNHKIVNHSEKYNYIELPKDSGYRGIHDVFRHFPRKHRDIGTEKRPWDGLMMELQFRTRAQHAWATAVEISDLLDAERTKFELKKTDRGQFFALASELIARVDEGMKKAFPDKSTAQLRTEISVLETNYRILERLEALKQYEGDFKFKRHNVLNVFRDGNDQLQLEVKPFKNAATAIQAASEIEKNFFSVNTVYVRADNPAQLRSAYRNYFNDPLDFVELLKNCAGL